MKNKITKDKLTPKQRDAMKAIRELFKENKDVAPSEQEIANKIGCSRSMARKYIVALVKKGHLFKYQNARRAVRIE
jgi:response regulator of citrate/malate metabolism